MVISPHICVNYLLDGVLGSHLLLHCPFSRKIWDYFLSSLHLSWVIPKTLFDLLSQWNAPFRHFRYKIFCLALLYDICWGIWNEQNQRIFHDKAKSFHENIDAIIFEVASWAMVFPYFKGLCVSDVTRDFFPVSSTKAYA